MVPVHYGIYLVPWYMRYTQYMYVEDSYLPWYSYN